MQEDNNKLLLYKLKELGVPIEVTLDSDDAGLHNDLKHEDIFVSALSVARKNPTLARALPVGIAKHKNVFSNSNVPYLKKLAERCGESKTLGFFLDMTADLTGDNYYADIADNFSEDKSEDVQDFFTETKLGKHEKKLLDLNTPPVAKKWQFRMNMKKDSFSGLFNKFATA